jgi:O-succinylbenzoic acid--CoA ligase
VQPSDMTPAPLADWWLGATAARLPAQLALCTDGERVSYRELAESSIAWACVLAEAGAGPGRCVAWLAAASRGIVETIHAAHFLGAIVHPLGSRSTTIELRRQLASTQPRVIVTDETHSGRAHELSASSGARVVHIGRTRPYRPGQKVCSAPPPADAPHSFLGTSGTAADPKIVELSYGNHHASTLASAARLDFAEGQIWLCALPLHHVGGLSMLIRAAIVGAAVVLRDSFDALSFRDDIVNFGVSRVSVVPTMLHRFVSMLADGDAEPALRGCEWLVGGATLPDALAADAFARGLSVRSTYGLTETASQVTTCERDELRAHPGSVGRPLPRTRVRIDAPDEAGVGGILVAGPQLFSGYLGDVAATRRVVREGWFSTGDVGRLDREGRLYVASRRDDLIVTGGENVRPEEVEAMLESHPAVAEAGVFGVADAEWGQRVVAAVVAKEGARIDIDDLEAWCRRGLAGFKVPRTIEPVATLPRTAGGKLMRAKLRDG